MCMCGYMCAHVCMCGVHCVRVYACVCVHMCVVRGQLRGAFQVWIILLNMMISGFIKFPVNVTTFFPLWLNKIPWCVCTMFHSLSLWLNEIPCCVCTMYHSLSFRLFGQLGWLVCQLSPTVQLRTWVCRCLCNVFPGSPLGVAPVRNRTSVLQRQLSG